MTPARLQRLVLLILILGAMLSTSARAQFTYYTDKAAFLAASGATLQATFEGLAPGPKPDFTEGNLSFVTYGGQLYVVQVGSTDSNPLPTSQMLTGNGSDDIGVRFASGTGVAIGFHVNTNRFAPATITVIGTDAQVLGSFTCGIGPNQYGFVGIFCPSGLEEVRWSAVGGNIQDSSIDDVYSLQGATSTPRSSWSRIKTLYR